MAKDERRGMTRREFNRALVMATGLATASGARCAPAPAQSVSPSTVAAPAVITRKRLNILLLVSDQERAWPDLPAGLGLDAHEWLLERGTGFTNFNMHTTPCSPARSTIYCGQHTQLTRVTTNLGAPPFPVMADIPTIGHMLRAQGYYTAYKGKWHLSKVPEDPTLQYGPFPSARDALEPYGFSDYSNVGIADGGVWSGYTLDGQTASEACLWLREKGRTLDRPWLLAVNFVNPHDIVFFDDYDRQQARTRYDRDFLTPLAPPPQEAPYDRTWDLPLPKSYYADRLQGKPWAQTSYVDFCNALYGRIDRDDEVRWRHYQSYYYNCIRDVDRHAMTVLRTLQSLGLDQDTVVIYLADHGEMLGAHGLRQKGPFMYKENMRVPFIVRHPDARGGYQTAALGGAIDLAPTLLAIAGMNEAQRAAKFPALKGVDLLPAVADPNARTARDRRGHLYDYNTMLYVDPGIGTSLFAEHERATWWNVFKVALEHGRLRPSLDHPGLFRGIHDGRYKFARYFKPSEHHMPKDWDTLLKHNQLELYDTQVDPDEIVNLASQPELHKELILELNAKTNALIMEEIGFDDGREHPGPDFLYRL